MDLHGGVDAIKKKWVQFVKKGNKDEFFDWNLLIEKNDNKSKN